MIGDSGVRTGRADDACVTLRDIVPATGALDQPPDTIIGSRMRGVTFGTPAFETDQGRIEPESGVPFAVLLLSAAAPADVGISRDEVTSLLWPSAPTESARHSLRQTMYRLRQLGFPIQFKRGHVVLSDVDTEIDLRDLSQGPVSRSDLLRLGTQGFLPGYFPRVGTEFSAWVQELRDRTDRVRRRALVEALREARSRARFRDVHKLSRALLSLDPFNETATLALAEALVMDGSKVEALKMLEEYEREVGKVSEALKVPVRTLRRRVSEWFDDALLPQRFEVPFVGREEEFRKLRDGFVEVRQGCGMCFVVTGEPGIGKTRTATEMLRLSVLDGARVISYSCTPGDALTPLASLLALTHALLDQPGALGCAGEHLQYLRQLLSPDPSAPPSLGMSADVAYAQLVFSLAELTAAVTHESPVILFIDDAHRLHQTSWRLFSDVVDRLPDKRVMLLFAARQLPEWYGDLRINGSDARSRHVPLAVLTSEESMSFVEMWSEKNQFDAGGCDAERLTGTAAGNPFYLGELLGHLARGGEEGDTPMSIKELIQLQYAALGREGQRALVGVSLLLGHATIPRLRSVLRVEPSKFVAVLEELERAGLVMSRGAQLVLRHGLIADVVLRLAPAGSVQYLRMRVAGVLERDGRRLENADLLGDALTHWERAEDSRRVLRVCLSLGSRLRRSALMTEAVATYAKARTLPLPSQHLAKATAGLAKTLIESRDWAALERVRDDLPLSLLDRLRPVDSDFLQLGLAEGMYWSRASVPSPGVLEAYYYDRGKEHQIRAYAVRLGLTIADNLYRGREYLSEHGSAISSALGASRQPEEALLIHLMIRAIVEDRRGVLDAVREMERHTPKMPPGERVRVLRFVANSLGRVGCQMESLARLEKALKEATELRLSHHRASCLWMIADSRLQLGQPDRAVEFAIALKDMAWTKGIGEPYCSFSCCAMAFCAFLEDSAHLAEDARAQLLLHASSGLPKNITTFARLALMKWYDDLCSEEDFICARKHAEQVLFRGTGDVELLVVANALHRLGESDLAREMMRTYFGGRRADSAPPCELFFQRLPIDLHPIVNFCRGSA